MSWTAAWPTGPAQGHNNPSTPLTLCLGRQRGPQVHDRDIVQGEGLRGEGAQRSQVGCEAAAGGGDQGLAVQPLVVVWGEGGR